MGIQNLVVNGDFEATRVNASTAGPNFNSKTGEGYIINHTPQGWSLVYGSGVDLLNDVHGKFGANKTPYGQYVELDGRMNTGISQNISTTSGKSYLLSFDWALPSYAGGNYKFPDYSSKFDVVLNGKTLFSYDGSYGVRNAWTHQDIYFISDSNTATLQFLEKGVSDAEGTLLDNISVIEAPVVRGNSLYTIVDGPSWTQAEANSVKLGGHLIAINSAEEQTFIQTNNLVTENLWIGNSDAANEGVWKWVNGDTTTYSNWQPGEPNNQNDEDYGTIYATGKWNDGHESGLPRGIAETPFTRRGDSAYVIVQGPTWEEAEANAVKLGGHLVTINDAAENDWLIKTYTINTDNRVAEQQQRYYWTGLTDKRVEGTFEWISGEQSSYRKWAAGEPSNGSNSPQGEDFVHLGWDNGWNDFPSQGTIPYYAPMLARHVGIAEIQLAPNNLPTGTPSITGTLKAGSTLTIDATTIQDADNFTGYTPTYQYSWETSTDGTTWSKLTSTDATDNNTTYTLTSAEVGKQIRGVVSYLDGYGTQESVPSTGSVVTTSAPPTQSLTLATPSKPALRSGVSATSAIAYNVSTGETSLTGIGASLFFDSTQLTVGTAGDPFQKGLIGSSIIADTKNEDGDPKTDKILSLSYADFAASFPGTGTTLPLTLANLNLVPTTTYSGTTLHLKGTPAVGYTATGADLTLGYNAAPVVTSTLPTLTTNRDRPFTYTLRSDLFTDADSTLTLSATTSTGSTLPSWLSFNPTTRTFSGTPTSGGTVNLNVTAADELGSVSTPLTLKVREVQSISSTPSTVRYQRNKDFTLPLNYSTTDGSSSTGLAFKVHFNSNLFSFDPTTGVKNKVAADIFDVGAVQQDTTDADNDPTTDRYVSVTVASLSGQLASASKLADLTFRAADKAIDSLTGLRDTSINFTETAAASGYGFAATSASLKPLSFSLDVDGDGAVTALGDGLMVIRYLFGSAFTGDALINKAISPDSPLLGGIPYASMTPTQKAGVASQVAANIQQGVDSGLLDVDKDGKTTALGDGLMVIRRLFGSAFEGAALTNKAISPESPYFGPPANFAAVAANIDALKPTPTVPTPTI